MTRRLTKLKLLVLKNLLAPLTNTGKSFRRGLTRKDRGGYGTAGRTLYCGCTGAGCSYGSRHTSARGCGHDTTETAQIAAHH
jgi:hypothetical protein